MNLRWAVFLLFCSAILNGCDNFQFNPNAPSPISRSTGGPELRIHPNVGSVDYKRMFTNPEEWEEARSRISAFQFHHANAMGGDHSLNYTPDGGSNSFENLSGAGAFEMLSRWGIPISIEMGALKHFNCEFPERDMPAAVANAIQTISNVKSARGRVIDVSMDEPFMGGMLRFEWDGKVVSGCEYSAEKTAQLTLDHWIRPVQAAHPDVKIGLTEAYPTYDLPALKRNILALEQAGYRLPFLHLDYDRFAAIRENKNPEKDFRELQSFLKSRGIIFGLVIWGESGASTEEWYSDAMVMASSFRNSLGNAPDRIIIESWSRADGPTVHASTGNDPRYYPDNLPESRPGTMTYMINQMSRYFR